ncbi:MAG: PAS domain-containing protein [Nitrospirae bacterium]|nr:PAS domain-containing protein [Nitrospirota bacterium]
MFLFKSLTAKFIFMGMIMLAFIASYITATYTFTHHMKGESKRINLAGRERMLLVEIAKHLLEIADMPLPGERTNIVEDMKKEMNMYEEILFGLRDGSEKHGLSPIHSHARDAIKQNYKLIDMWQKVQKPEIERMMNMPDKRKAREFNQIIIYGYIKEIDKLATLIEKHTEKEIKDFDTFRYYAFGFFFIGTGFIIFYIRQSIVKPVRKLTDVAAEVERGNFDVRVDVKGRDEIGILSEHYNQMAQTLALLFMEKASHLRELVALNQISAAASKSLTLETMLNGIMDAIMELEPLRLEKKGAIFLCDEDKKTLKLIVSCNFSDEHAGLCSTVPYGECLCGLCAEEGKIIFSDSSVQDRRHTGTYSDIKEHGHIILPLKSRDKMLGVLCLYLSAGIKLSDREIEMYKSISDIISVSMQNALNYEKTQQSEAGLRDAQRIAHLGNWDWDIVNNILYWSDEIYRIFGLEPQEFGSTYEGFLNSVHPDDREFVKNSVDKALYEKMPYSIDHRIVLPDTTKRIVHEQAEVTFDENGKPIKMAGTVQDITERKKLAEQLREYSQHLEEKVKERTKELEDVNLAIQADNQELQAKRIEAEEAKLQAESANRAKSDFLANMSHELRTPLNSIIGFSEVMRDGMAGTVTDEQKEYLNDIWESGKHLLRLINDILDLSKVEAGKMELELSEFDVGETIRSCLLLFKEKTMKHSIKLSEDVSANIGSITADERKIKQVILNLLGNAFKFTPDGGSVRVQARLVHSSQSTVHGQQRSSQFTDHSSQIEEKSSAVNREQRTVNNRDFIEISVEDTGIGIAPEDMENLFKPFHQLESVLTKQYEGTGLGLKLCKDFVELHGGKIWAESKVGKGSKFVFVIPIRQLLTQPSQERGSQ